MADPSRTPSPPGSGGFSPRTGLVDVVEMGLEMAVAGRLRPWIRPAGPDPRGPPDFIELPPARGGADTEIWPVPPATGSPGDTDFLGDR